jgi:hypothetical protein
MTEAFLEHIVQNNHLHAKWLNTLSYLENCGARKISKYEHSNKVDIIVLKHAAEEHRHAFYLKKMIERVEEGSCPYYGREDMLGGHSSLHYLHRLDIDTARYLKKHLNVSGARLKDLAYLLVTYAIEMRADELYPMYHAVLKQFGSKVSVYNIIKEEEGHLREMIAALEAKLQNWEEHAKHILAIEGQLFDRWIASIENEIGVAV